MWSLSIGLELRQLLGSGNRESRAPPRRHGPASPLHILHPQPFLGNLSRSLGPSLSCGSLHHFSCPPSHTYTLLVVSGTAWYCLPPPGPKDDSCLVLRAPATRWQGKGISGAVILSLQPLRFLCLLEPYLVSCTPGDPSSPGSLCLISPFPQRGLSYARGQS